MDLNEKRPYRDINDASICGYSSQNDQREVLLVSNGVLGHFFDKVHNTLFGGRRLGTLSANADFVTVRVGEIAHRPAPALRQEHTA